MPSRQEKKRAKRREKYLQVRDDVLESARASYKADPEKKRTAEREGYHADPAKKQTAELERYHADPEKKRSAKRESYAADPEKKVNRPENLSLFKYIWIERNEKGEAAIQQSLGYLGMKKN